MTIIDQIYGQVKISEPVLIELINCKPLQRLKQIHQTGANYFHWPQAKNLTRFDHSVGVMLLLRRLGSSLEEQVAGLLHDVSHSAFSHVLDYLTDNRDHTAHEQFNEQFVASTNLPQLLHKHGLDPKKIFDHHNWPLLEQPAPSLCADRLDYFMRDSLAYGVLSKTEVEQILRHLDLANGCFVVNDREVALMIGQRYLEMDRSYWAGSANSLAINYAVVEMIKRGLDLGIIKFEDLWHYGDDELIGRLRQSGDANIERWFGVLNPEVSIHQDNIHYDVYVYPKIRLIDPPVLENGRIRKLSQINSAYADQLAEAREFPTELYLRFNQ